MPATVHCRATEVVGAVVVVVSYFMPWAFSSVSRPAVPATVTIELPALTCMMIS